MNRTLLVFLSLPILAALAYFCVSKHISEIPIDIKNRTYDNLNAAGINAVGATTDGRDVTLTGIVETDDIKKRAEETTFKTEGVRKVDNQIMVAPPAFAEGEDDTAPPMSEDEINQKCDKELKEYMNEHTILFASGSAVIEPQSIEVLEAIADIARQCPDSHLLVGGHTDNVGQEAVNEAVSLQRAQAVAEYLKNTAKLPQSIEAKGFGESKPLLPNDSKENRARNRRIEFSVLPIKEEE